MPEQFKVGDTVQIKSGGPVMTVAAVRPGSGPYVGKQMVECRWFDGNKYETAYLDAELLVTS